MTEKIDQNVCASGISWIFFELNLNRVQSHRGRGREAAATAAAAAGTSAMCELSIPPSPEKLTVKLLNWMGEWAR